MSFVERLGALGDEVTRLHFRMTAALEAIHGPGLKAYGGRAVLRNLVELGAQTVPQLAALRPVSRQYMQTVVNDLADAGLVALRANPAHRRSPLIEITAAGRDHLAAMLTAEAPALAGAAEGIDPAEIETAIRLLRRLTETADRVVKQEKSR